MKKTTCLQILCICWLFSFLPSIAQSIWPETVVYKTECHICGKTIQERREVERVSYFDNMGQVRNPFDMIPDSLRVQYLEYNKKIEICPDCLRKYGTEVIDEMNWLWNKHIGKLIAKNNDKRKQYSQTRHKKEVRELELKIKKLQSELQGKKSE